MIEIRIDDKVDYSSIGRFQPQDIESVLELLRKYGVFTAEGDMGEVQKIYYDVGVSPHIWVACEYGGEQ